VGTDCAREGGTNVISNEKAEQKHFVSVQKLQSSPEWNRILIGNIATSTAGDFSERSQTYYSRQWLGSKARFAQKRS
jgi:hypothetical protein